MKKFGVIGNPISHSLSPQLHNYIYNKFGIYAEYSKLLIKDSYDLSEFIIDNKFDGFNITLPYKEIVLTHSKNINMRGKTIGSGNVAIYKDNQLFINNTDWFGFLLALKNNKINLYNKEVIIIGMGGVGKAIYYALNTIKVKKIKIFSRKKIKNSAFIKNSNTSKFNINKLPDYIDENSIIINCTPIGMNDNNTPFDTSLITSKQIIIDTIYKLGYSELIKSAIERGAKIMDGLDMFIYQGLLSHEIWFNDDVIAKINMDKIKKHLKNNYAK